MICENCRLDSENFGPICSVCGAEAEYAPKKTETKIPHGSSTEPPVEKKPLTSLEIKRKKSRERERFLWFFL